MALAALRKPAQLVLKQLFKEVDEVERARHRLFKQQRLEEFFNSLDITPNQLWGLRQSNPGKFDILTQNMPTFEDWSLPPEWHVRKKMEEYINKPSGLGFKEFEKARQKRYPGLRRREHSDYRRGER